MTLAARGLRAAAGRSTIQKPVSDALSASAASAGGTTLTWSHTVGSGLTNSILIVHVANSGNAANSHFPTGVTYNGVAFTAVTPIATTDGSDAHPRTSSLWYLVNPPAGAANIVVTMNSGTSVNYAGIGWSLQHAAQSSPFSTPGTAVSNSTNNISASCTATDTTDMIIGAIATRNQFPNVTNSLSYVKDWNANANNTYAEIAQKTAAVGSNTGGFSWTTADDAALVVVALHGAA
jgi:hypothetical protein